MTPEECDRMNQLCLRIQEETNYENFAALLQELGELIARKEQRRFSDHPPLIWQRTRPSRTMSAMVNKLLTSVHPTQPEKVEITIESADALFREVRFANFLTDVDGLPVTLKHGSRVDVTFEADASECVKSLSASNSLSNSAA